MPAASKAGFQVNSQDQLATLDADNLNIKL